MSLAQEKKLLQTKQLFLDYLRGESLRELAKRAGLTHQALSVRFRKLHPNYAELVRKGVLATFRRYIVSKRVSQRQKKLIGEWVLENLQKILEVESRPGNFLTDKKIEQLSRAETGGIQDLRGEISDLVGWEASWKY